MKKVCILLTVLALALTATGCSQPSNQEYYESAQLYLGSGDYEIAAELFHGLGGYSDSADYALYTEALSALEDKKYDLARANFAAIAPFQESERYLTWLDAVEAEDAGNTQEALALYAVLGTFRKSDRKATELRKAIPEATLKEGRALMAKGEYAAARELFLSLNGYGASRTLAENCTLAINKAAYSAAEELAKAGDQLGAIAAFTAMGDVLDAPQRAEEIRASLRAELEKQFAQVTLANAADLLNAYAALDDEEAQNRVASLTERFGMNLTVLSKVAEHPYVLLNDATLWRIDSAKDAMLTLQFEGFAAVKPEETAAIPEATAEPTPTAEPTALPSSEPAANPSAEPTAAPEESLAPIATATVAPMTADLTPAGLMLHLDLTAFTFTKGSGTLADPFR